MNKTGYIYSLTCSNPNLIYYGSTTKPLNDRLSGHKNNFKNNKQVSSKILFEWGNVKINMIEEINFEDKKELLDREAYYIKNLECVNKKIPNRTDKQYYSDNKDKIKQKIKKYYEKNKEKKQQQNKKYYEKNKEKKQQYYSDNKDKILKNLNVKITCDCGLKTTKGHYNRHCKSKKHLQYIEESNIII